MIADLNSLYLLSRDILSPSTKPIGKAASTPRAEAGDFFRALEWIDRVLPNFTDACRNSIAACDVAAFAEWRAWIEGSGIDAVREVGDDALFQWRRAWLTILMDAGERLCRSGVDDVSRRKLAEYLMAEAASRDHARSFRPFPAAFWQNLSDLLAGHSAPKGEVRVATFPLVLTEPMVIDGDAIDVLLAEFIVERVGYGGNEAYLDPDQVAVRCLAPDFLSTFALASQCAGWVGARVRLQSRLPRHDVFLKKLLLSGGSGGGALAVGLHTLGSGRPMERDLAISFALSDSGDGRSVAVGGAYEKVRGCAKHGIHRLIVSDEQSSQVAFYGHLQNVNILGAADVAHAVGFLATLAPDITPSRAESEAQNVVAGDPAPVIAPDDGGVLPLGSPLYLERPSDAAFHEAIAQRPMIVLVKGARQIGKTSLLVRGVDKIRRSNAKLVYVDLQSMERDSLRTQRDFFSALSRIFARELNLDVTMDDLYDHRDGPNKNFENFLFRHVLTSPVVWFMDEVDRLFEFDFYTDVFSLMRSWHNRRPIHRELECLTLVLSYATETHLLIEDAYQSPFNVGIKVELEDFTLDQIAILNERMRQPLKGEGDVAEFTRLVGGHPHLVCRGLSWMSRQEKSVADFTSRASLEHGPFGTHLRRLRMLAQNPELLTAVQEILRNGSCSSNDAFLHLRSAGVVVGDDCQNLAMRCEIYASYLRRLFPGTAGPAAPRGGRRSLWTRLLTKEAR